MWTVYDAAAAGFPYAERYVQDMGGSGGKRYRDRVKAATATIDGNFNSIGDVSEQKQNLVLVTRLLGEIGQEGYAYPIVTSNERLFINDCRIKLNQEGGRSVYGWRQVASLVAIHQRVVAYRDQQETKKRIGKGTNGGVSGAGPLPSTDETREP